MSSKKHYRFGHFSSENDICLKTGNSIDSVKRFAFRYDTNRFSLHLTLNSLIINCIINIWIKVMTLPNAIFFLAKIVINCDKQNGFRNFSKFYRPKVFENFLWKQ